MRAPLICGHREGVRDQTDRFAKTGTAHLRLHLRANEGKNRLQNE